MEEKERFEAPYVTKLRSPNVAQLGDTLSCKTLTAVPIPQLWGASLGFGGAAGDQDFRLISDLWSPSILPDPCTASWSPGMPFLRCLEDIFEAIPKGQVKNVGSGKSGCQLSSLPTSPCSCCFSSKPGGGISELV